MLSSEYVPIARPTRQASNRAERGAEFRSDFLSGRYDACLTAIRGDSSLDDTLMAATALRRLGRDGDALALLGVVEEDVVGGGDDLKCGRFCLERGTALASLGDPAAGRSFGLARAFLLRADSLEAPAALAELALREAWAAWNDGERTLAISSLERTAMDASPDTRAWARHLRGQIAASDLDFRAQLDAAHETLRELATRDEPDVWLEATTLRTLAHVAIELDERHVTKLVRSRADALAWTQATAAMEHDVFRYLAWYEELRGATSDTQALLRRSAQAAPTERRRIASLVDAVRLARLRDDPQAFERIDAACLDALHVSWEHASVAELEALLELAQLSARVDPPRSTELIERYRDVRPYSMSIAQHQPLAIARERFWLGAAAAERGERALARGHLQHAFDFWCTVEFLPRTAMAACLLVSLGSHADAAAFLHAHADRWPRTLLGERIAKAL